MEQPNDEGGVAEQTCSYCGSATCPAALDINAACPEEDADMLEDDLDEDMLDEDDEEYDETDGGPDNTRDEAI